MAVAEDVSTPVVARSAANSTATTLATASFTPPAGAWLLAMCQTEPSNTAMTTDPGNQTVVASGGVGTWTNKKHFYDATGQFNIMDLWVAQVTTSQAMTVTMTRPNASAGGFQLGVRVLTGCGGSGTVVAASNATTARNTAITPTAIGSMLYVINGMDSNVTETALANTTTIDDWEDSTNFESLTLGKYNTTTASLSAVTIGWTSSVTHNGLTGAIEMVPGVAAGATPRPPRLVQSATRIRSSYF